MHNPDITIEDVKEFKGNAVWEEIIFRLAQRQEILFGNILNTEEKSDATDKREYKLITEIRDYPDLFVEELTLEKEEQDAERRAEKGRTGAANRF